MPYAKREYQTRQSDLALVINRIKKACGAFFTPAFAVLKLLQTFAKPRTQCENISRCRDPIVCVKLLNLFGTQSFDVERGTRNKMFEFLNGLCRADNTA